MKRFVTYIRRWRTITWLLVWVARNLVTRLWLLAWRYGNLVVTNLDRNGWNTSSRSDFTIRNVLTGDNVITGWSSWRNRNWLIRLTSKVRVTNFNIIIYINIDNRASLSVGGISNVNSNVFLTILNRYGVNLSLTRCVTNIRWNVNFGPIISIRWPIAVSYTIGYFINGYVTVNLSRLNRRLSFLTWFCNVNCPRDCLWLRTRYFLWWRWIIALPFWSVSKVGLPLSLL